MHAPRAAMVVRLSRDDLRAPGSLEEKAARHHAIACELAQRHSLPIAPEDTFTFLALSGRKLLTDPAFVRLLSLCETGQITHIVTAFSDRLLRGDKHAEATIEDALLAGEITLIASDAVIAFDEEYDSRHALTFEVKAAAARQYLRDITKKLRENNRQRHQKGIRSGGMAAYGYQWIKARYEDRRLVEGAHYEIVGTLEIADATRIPPGHTEDAYLALARKQGQPGGALLPGVTCTGGEYAILCELFRRMETEGYYQIVKDLNARGIPTPGVRRFREEYAAPHWSASTLKTLVRKTFYSGFPAHTTTTDRKGRRIPLPPEKWIVSETEQSYPHPLRLPEQQALLAKIAARSSRGVGRLTSCAYLTGVLFCAEGRPTRGLSERYNCACTEEAHPHRGSNIAKSLAHAAVERLFAEVIPSLPDASLGKARKAAAPDLDAQVALLTEIRQKQSALEELRRHAAMFERAGTEAGFQATIQQAEAEIKALQARQQQQHKRQQSGNARQALDRLQALRQAGASAFWQQATPQEKKAILPLFVERLEIIAPEREKAFVKEIRVVVPFWIAPFYDPGTVTVPNLRGPRKLKSP